MNENEKYHSDTSRISKSGLDLIEKAPAKYWERYLNPDKDPEERTEALIFGSAFHAKTLEPDVFENSFVLIPAFKGIGSKEKKEEFIQMNAGKDVLTPEQYKHLEGMNKALQHHPKARRLLFEGVAEQQFNWIDPFTGAKCKCKPDFFNEYIIDLKSTDDASLEGFKRSARKFRYFVQDPFYRDGMKENGIIVKGFIFIAVEKKPPYLVNLFIYDEDDADTGRSIYRENLATYIECLEKNVWPGHGDEVKNLTIY